MIKYPNGKKYLTPATKQNKKSNIEISISSANRGMDLENDINISNEYYKDKGIALISKRPTPINIVKVDYTKGAKIVDAYFETQSTTDYNGIYKGRYIDFEAKNTKNKTSFPLANISLHQIEHLKNVISHNGIALCIINFETLNLTYLVDASLIIEYHTKKERKSIPLDVVKSKGIEIKRGYNPRLFYIDAIEEKYFKD